MSLNLKNKIILNAKNLIGYKTKRKIIVFSVDDYGNVRVDSKKAREHLNNAGLKIYGRFDAYDALETREDLESLYDVLTTVKDCTGRYAVFTAFSVSCNINFENIIESGYSGYSYELVTETFKKKSADDNSSYRGVWNLWRKGIELGLFIPQFHGREHLNVKVFEEKLTSGDHDLMTCLKNRSFTSISKSAYNTISPMAAFDFWKFNENDRFHEIIRDGLNQFEKVFNFRAEHFTPPVYRVHSVLNTTLSNSGIRFVDTGLLVNQHQGEGKFKKTINYTGKVQKDNIRCMVRNVVFEPTENRGIDWVNYAMKQIEAAFRWNRPAIISSHRVNFCGHIDESNRKKGLKALRELLQKITQRWPEVEFMAANELGDIIQSEFAE